MNILYITMDGFDTASPNNQMAEQLIDGFLKLGHSVHLIQSERKHEYDLLPETLVDRKGFTSDTLPRKVIDKSNFVKRYLDEAKYAFQMIPYARKHRDCDVVFLQSCPTVFFQEVLLKLFVRKPVLYNVYDVWPGQTKSLNINKIIYAGMDLLSRLVYRMSSAVVVLSEDMVEACAKAGCPREKLWVVPPWYDDRRGYDIDWESNRFVEKFGIPRDKFYVQFAGSIGLQFNWRTMLEVAKLLGNEPDIVIQIVGDGCVKEQFIEAVRGQGLSNVEFYPLQPVDMVPDVYSAGDVCLIPLRREVIYTGTPSKMPILLACGKAIVSSVEKDSLYAAMVERDELGVCVEIDNAEELASAIKGLHGDPSRFEHLRSHGQEYARENLSRTICVKKMADVLTDISGGGSSR